MTAESANNPMAANTISECCVANAQVLAQETGCQLLFLHRVVHGGASRSYGIEAARQVLGRIEAKSHVAVGLAPQG